MVISCAPLLFKDDEGSKPLCDDSCCNTRMDDPIYCFPATFLSAGSSCESTRDGSSMNGSLYAETESGRSKKDMDYDQATNFDAQEMLEVVFAKYAKFKSKSKNLKSQIGSMMEEIKSLKAELEMQKLCISNFESSKVSFEKVMTHGKDNASYSNPASNGKASVKILQPKSFNFERLNAESSKEHEEFDPRKVQQCSICLRLQHSENKCQYRFKRWIAKTELNAKANKGKLVVTSLVNNTASCSKIVKARIQKVVSNARVVKSSYDSFGYPVNQIIYGQTSKDIPKSNTVMKPKQPRQRKKQNLNSAVKVPKMLKRVETNSCGSSEGIPFDICFEGPYDPNDPRWHQPPTPPRRRNGKAA